jgi:hypothetical protein
MGTLATRPVSLRHLTVNLAINLACDRFGCTPPSRGTGTHTAMMNNSHAPLIGKSS